MSSGGTRVPNIPAVGDAKNPEQVQRALDALREAMEVGYGRRGEKLDRFVTLRELEGAGIVKSEGGQVRGAGSAITGGQPGATLPAAPPTDFGETDFTVPPAPTGIRVRGVSPTAIAVTWDPPNYRNHWFTEVYSTVSPNTTLGTMIGLTPGFNIALPHRSTNVHAAFVGSAEGVIFVHDLDANGDGIQDDNSDNPGGTAIQRALTPQTRYYWLRFVSRAGVTGPFAPNGTGTSGRPMLDPGRVLDAMTASVTSTTIYNNLRRLLGGTLNNTLTPAQREAQLNRIDTAGGLAKLTTETLDQTWSVRMQSTGGGVINSAGFGLGLTTDRQTGNALSTFIVNANQFAIMGPTTPAVQVGSLTVSGGTATVTFQDAVTGNALSLSGAILAAFVALQTDGKKVVFLASEDVSAPASIAGLAGKTFDIVSIGASSMTLSGTFAGNVSAADAKKWNLCVAGDASIPFIVDTVNNVVGIRGSLVVNGLISANEAEFQDLTVTTGFIQHLSSEIMRADLVVANRLIAGVSEATDAGWRAEMNKPGGPGDQANWRPFRYWDPSTGQVGFEVDGLGNATIGRNLSVGANAVIRTTGSVLTSIGGNGSDGDYALWVGPTANYGTQGNGRSEANGLFWIRSNGRAGFNADLFSGEIPFQPPSSDGTILVRAERGGGAGRVFASAIVSLAPDGNGSFDNTVLGVDLYIVPSTFTGPGARTGSLRTSLAPDSGMAAYLDNHVGIYTTLGTQPTITGGILLASTQYDWRGSADIKNATIMGTAVVPASLDAYKAFVAIWRKAQDSGRLHAAWRVDCFAMHVGKGGAAGAGQSAAPKTGGSSAAWTEPPPGGGGLSGGGGTVIWEPGYPPTEFVVP